MSDPINFCACIGPVYGEPHCYCEMQRRGLPLNKEARDEDKRKLNEAMEKFFQENKNAHG